MYCKGDGMAIFTRPLLILGKVTLMNMRHPKMSLKDDSDFLGLNDSHLKT